MKQGLLIWFLCLLFNANSQTMDICGDAVPSGWITTDVKSTYCATLSGINYIGRTIKKYDELPAGSIIDICGDTVPSGWITIAVKSTYCTTLGGVNYIGRTIIKLDPNAVAGSVMDICGGAVPSGWITTDVKSTYCTTLSGYNYIGRTIKKIDGLPAGSTIDICGDVVPSGWITTAVKSTYCTTLGGFNYIGRTIRKLEPSLTELDSLALVDLYNNTTGTSWTNKWNLDQPLKNWYGVSSENGRVNLLILSSNNLTGSIPESIGNLSNLTYLDLSFNKLSGSIPSSIGNLQKLETLYLDSNKLNGSIPSSISNLSKLTYLRIFSNQFTFDGIENIASKFNFALYSPQANVTIHKITSKLAVSAGGTLKSNTYKWYKNNTLDATIVGDSIYIPLEDGNYNVEVTNAIATALILYSDTILYSTIVLPITLLNFSVALSAAQTAQLFWQTATEINAKSFTIQRSNNGRDFTSMAILSSKGSNSTYNFIDNLPLKGYNYYRLLITNKDGSNNYSEIRSINITNGFTARLYPNPVNGLLTIELNNEKPSKAGITITGSDGKTVKQLTTQLLTGNNKITIPVAGLASGTYLLRITTNEGPQVLKFVKE